MPRISVIIPLYNAAEFLVQCLDSVLAQDIAKEIICVDDCSTDSSCQIVESYIARGCPIKLLKNDTNRYAGYCRNRGTLEAKGEYIHYLDADDFLVDGAYNRLYEIAKKHSVDVLRCNSYVYDNLTKRIGETEYYSHKRMAEQAFDGVFKLVDRSQSFLKGVVAPWSGLIRREFVVGNKLQFNNLFCVNDRSFYFESLVKADRIMFVRDFILYYRQNNSKSLIGNRAAHFECQFESFKLISRIADNLPRGIKTQLLSMEMLDIERWVRIFRKADSWEVVIKPALKKFLKGLTIEQFGVDPKSTSWYRNIVELFEIDKLEQRASKYDVKVSVIMPVYNSARYLEDSLGSLQNQSFKSAEFICVDDGSSDDSISIIKRFQSKDARFKLLTQEHKFAGTARNLGIKHARGECIAFLDSDDVYEENCLFHLYRAIVSNNANIAVCDANFYYGKTKKKVRAHYLNLSNVEDCLNPHDCSDIIMTFTPGNPWNKMLRRDFIQKNKLAFLPIRRSEDVFFVYPALMLAKRIAIVNKPLVNYRVDNEDSLEHTKDETPLLFLDAYLKLKDDMVRRRIYDRFRVTFIRRIAKAFVYNLEAVNSFDAFSMIYEQIKHDCIARFGLLQDIRTEYDDLLRKIVVMSCGDFLVNRFVEMKKTCGKQSSELSNSRTAIKETILKLKEVQAQRDGLLTDCKELSNKKLEVRKLYKERDIAIKKLAAIDKISSDDRKALNSYTMLIKTIVNQQMEFENKLSRYDETPAKVDVCVAQETGGHTINYLKSEVLALRNSESYRIGMFITAPFRFIYRTFCATKKGCK